MVYTPFVWLLLISAIINGGLAYYARHYRNVPSVGSFSTLMWIAATWALLYGLEISVTGLPLKLFILNITYIPSVLSALASLALALEYTGRKDWLTRRRLAIFLSVSLVFLLFAFTSQSHQFWRYDYRLIWSSSIPVIVASKGPMYWAYVLYMLGMSFAAVAILLTSLRYRALYFRNTIALTAGILIPVVTGILYVLGLTPIHGLDWVPTSFILVGALYIWAVLQGRLFDVVPIARNTIIDNMDDIFIVVNNRGNIVDFNIAAQTIMFAKPPSIGAHPQTLPQGWAAVFERYKHTAFCREEISVLNRVYELIISPVQDRHNTLGRVFLLHDITRLKNAEANEREHRIIAESLRDTAEALNSTINFNDVLGKILVNVGRVVPLDSANIALLDDDGILHFTLFHGYEKHKDAGRKLDVPLSGFPTLQKVSDTFEPLIISDTYNSPDWVITKQSEWVRSYAVMPIRAKDKVVGFLNLDSETIGMYNPEHLHKLRAFADQAAVALENARLFDAVEREVAERKQAEEKLLQLSRAVEQSPASILITDTQGLIEYVNPRFTEVTGYSAEEVVGKNPRILKTKSTPSNIHRELWETITAGREWRGEFVNRKKNSEIYHEAATISPIIDSNGKITHYLAVKEDVTGRRQAELRLQYQNDRLNALHKITLDLLNHHKMEEVLDAILLRAADLLESPFGLLDILEGNDLVIKAATDKYTASKNLRVPLKDAHLSRQAVESRTPQLLEDYTTWTEKLEIHKQYDLHAVANFPIIINENVIGVIALGRTDPNKPYTSDEVEVMGAFAQLAALAIDNAQLIAAAQNELAEKIHAEVELRNANQVLQFQLEAIEALRADLREQSIRDPLTGLYNRRYFNEVVIHELARAGREGYPVCFVMIDVDLFKNVNDKYGHNVGDRVLQRLANQLMKQTRAGDIVCRYGGEEFLVILPNVSGSISFQIAEKWRNTFQTSDVLQENGEEVSVTISCGLSEFPEDGTTSEDIIANADKALYIAKRTGRNRVIRWTVDAQYTNHSA
jgi:diguanylate cyclase (GGDEF)-like protein/PAS domain S-box-containing protein